jgi:protein-S-isoprenylcysteine O-methyltransferase Ste14
MFSMKKPFDLWSAIVVAVTFLLFFLALFFKGLTHDILLEAGVLLVSIKIIMMSSKITNISTLLENKLDDIHDKLGCARGD